MTVNDYSLHRALYTVFTSSGECHSWLFRVGLSFGATFGIKPGDAKDLKVLLDMSRLRKHHLYLTLFVKQRVPESKIFWFSQ